MATQAAQGSSGVPARGLSRRDRARRTVVIARSYGPWLRLSDNWHGWVDAKNSSASAAETPWLARLQATFDENGRRILAGTRDVLITQIHTLRSGHRELPRLDTAIADVEARLASIRAEQRGPGHGELHLPAEAIEQRAALASERSKAPLRAELDALRAQRDQVGAATSDAEATILEEFEVIVEVVHRMRAFYQRRAETYARRFLSRRDDADAWEVRIDLPAWAERPCPWLEPHAAPTNTLHLVS